MKLYYILLALAAGVMMPIQAGVNSILGSHLKTPFLAAFVSFSIGTIALAILCALLRVPLPGYSLVSKLPLWLWSGGLLGAFFVTSTIILAPKLGAVALLGTLIAAQMAASLILDHFGLIGYPVQPINIWRVFGVVFLIAGVILVQKY
ncbi:MAG: DMT family transporter [Desulfonatronovibrio sp.]